jgi:hypothetical protein
MRPSVGSDSCSTVFDFGDDTKITISFEDLRRPCFAVQSLIDDPDAASPECVTTRNQVFRINTSTDTWQDCVLSTATSYLPLPEDPVYPTLCVVVSLFAIRGSGKRTKDIRLMTLLSALLSDGLARLPRRYRGSTLYPRVSASPTQNLHC